MRALLAAGVLTLSLAGTACCEELAVPAGPGDFIGSWKVTDIAGFGGEGGGDKLAKDLMGKTLTITSTGMALGVDRWSCKARGYQVHEIDTDFLFEDAGVEASEVGLPPKAMALDSTGCLQVFWLQGGRIQFDYMGVFVKAKRVM